MELKDCDSLIVEMEIFLEKIYVRYSEIPPADSEIPFKIRSDIKHFLDNANSILDFTAFELYQKYSVYYLNHETYEKTKDYIYFIYKEDKNKFKKNMNMIYPNLGETNPDIYQAFEKHQKYGNSQWRKDLHQLVNQNKHKNLSLQKKTKYHQVNKINIPNMFNITGGQINFENNVVLENNQMTHYNDFDSFKKDFEHRGNIDTFRIFVFTDMKVPVLKTLEEILLGIKKVYEEFSEFEIKIE